MSQTKIIESAEKFLDLLARSQLFAPNQLEAIQKLAESSPEPLPIARTLVKKGWLTKWQASQLLSGFYNLTLGKYRLADHLGKGELGNVYLAENPKLNRKVALKTLSRKHTEDPELVKRFLDEASAAAALDHPNIVHVHDVSSEGQRHYVVMEYVTGRNLQSRVDAEGPLAFEEAASIIRQAAEGLRFAHEQGVVHRDIKPANIMVDEQGVAKILDIGVGHLRQPAGNPSEKNTGELMMSAIAYMAPEHARGREVDARCDVYSLGGVLYFLLTARAPFSTKTDAERAKIKASKRPIPLAELRPDTPTALVELCDRMMASKPDDRVASMPDVIAALASTDDLLAVAAASDEDEDVVELDEFVEVLVEEAADAAEPEAEAGEDAAAVKTSKPASKPELKSKPEGTKPAIKIDIGDSKPEPEGTAPAVKINVGDSKPAVAVGPMDFAINTKKRKKKSAAAPAPAAKAPAEKPAADKKSEPAVADATADDDKPTPANTAPDKPTPANTAAADTAPKKGLSKGLIIGGVCAVGLLLITGVGVGVGVGAMMLFSGGDKQVAQAPPGGAEGAGEPGVESAEGEATTDATVPDAAAVDSSAMPTGEAGSDPSAAPADSVTEPPADGVAAIPSANAAEPSAGDGDVAAVEPATADASTGEAEAPADPEMSKAEPPSETPAPDTPAEEKPAEAKPEPEETPPPEAKPAKPPEKKAPPKPKTFVFAPAVDLPMLAADAPELTLGQINIRPEDAVFISLDGGDIAAAGKTEFSVQNAQDGVAPRDWEFYLNDGINDPVVIATMSMPEKDLKFKWASAGIENPTATNLRNCSLRITAGQDQPQDLALRTPQKVAPVTIDVEKAATAKLPLEGAPDRNSLKMEVTVKGHKFMVEPAQIELGKGGEATIFFGENREQAAFALKLDASINARGVQVKTEPYLLVPFEKSPVKLNKATIKKYESFQAQQAGLQARVFDGEKALGDKRLSPQDKARGQVLLGQWKQQLDAIDKTVAKMAQLSTDMAAIGSGASLQFRVFSDTYEKQIDLIVPDPNAAPVAP